MNIPELVEWQRVDPDNGLVEPWWTWPCVEVIKTWNLKDKLWLEFGAGLSTAWLREKCKNVVSIEANTEWGEKALNYCIDAGKDNGIIFYSDLADGIPNNWPLYISNVPNWNFDIISVDGIFRNECLQWALDHFKGRGGILIVDNLDQDYVWISPAANELMAPYPCEIYYQPDHTNHEGKKWNTRIYRIPA